MRCAANAVVLLSLLSLAGCAAPVGADMRLIEDSAGMEHEIANFVPPGTPIDEARRIMERNGWVCAYEEFADVPYMVCTQRRFVNLGLTGQWTVHMYPRNGRVQNVRAAWDLTPTYRGRRAVRWIDQRRGTFEPGGRLGPDSAARGPAGAPCEDCEKSQPVFESGPPRVIESEADLLHL